MAQFREFEEIEVWQEARKLIRAIRAICRRENIRKDFSFVDQITRAARSISLNIAEGNDALTVPEFIRFLGIAKRSAAEVRAILYEGLDEKYLTREEFDMHNEHTKKITSMLAKLIHYLQTLDHDLKRTRKKRLPKT